MGLGESKGKQSSKALANVPECASIWGFPCGALGPGVRSPQLASAFRSTSTERAQNHHTVVASYDK